MSCVCVGILPDHVLVKPHIISYCVIKVTNLNKSFLLHPLKMVGKLSTPPPNRKINVTPL